MPLGPGPVFVYECITNARRWQTYAARSFCVVMLLLGMATIAWSNDEILHGSSARQYARLGEAYYHVLVGVQLSLVMLAAPAATAGAICQDRARGTLTHVLVTDLSDSEIVLGKLAARLLPVLGLVACTWPVMAISALLGGIDPVILTMAFGLIVVVAVLGCSLSLALSVWARKPYDVIVTVYSLWACVLLAYPVMWLLAAVRLVAGPPRWLLMADPVYMALASYSASGGVELADFVWFGVVSLAASATLVLAAVWRMRPVSKRTIDPGGKTKNLPILGGMTRWLLGPLLDANPVFWREWHRVRPSRSLSIMRIFLWAIATAACFYSAYTILKYGASPTKSTAPAMLLGLLAEVLLIFVGLLILSAAAPLAVAEERRQSSLDMLVVTPLSTRSIVLGKWLASSRLVPLLTIGPGVDMLALAAAYDNELSIRFRLFRLGLMLTTIVVHGALITSVGLALATWIKRPSRAIAMSVCVFVLVAIAWPICAYSAAPFGYAQGLAALSPVAAVALLADVGLIHGQVWSFHLWLTFWDVMVAYGAFGLLVLTIRSFDGCFGRMPEQIRRSPFIAVVVAVSAGGIAIACAAGAIVTWANVRYQQSLSPEDLIGLISATIIVMTVLSLLPAVATVAAPIDGSAAAMAAVLKCWWRAARLGLAVALGPGLIAFALATARAAEEPILPSPVRLPNLLTLGPSILGHRLLDCVLLTATIFAQGAAIAALSIALYVWTRRRDVAIALGAGLFWVAAVGWPLILWYSGGVALPHGLPLLSFLAVTTSLAAELVTREPQFPALLAWATFRIAILALVTAGLLWRTVRAVDGNPSTG